MRWQLWLLACVALGAWLALRLRRLQQRLLGRARQARGRRGEREAERLLRAHGYQICEAQARRAYEIIVDGQSQEVPLVLDYVVSRRGQRFVAEVKTGALAPRLQRSETRRQLLEYQLATGCEHVLLVDPEAATITEVSFPVTRSTATRSVAWLTLLVATGLLLLLVALWQRSAWPN